MSGIAFENIPGSGLVAPLFAFEVTSGGQFENDSKLVLFGHKTSSGTMADNVKTACSSHREAQQLAGVSMLSDMYRIARLNAPTQEILICAVPESGVAAEWTLTVASVPANGGAGVIEIHGEAVQVDAVAGDSATTVATALKDAINAYYNELSEASLMITAASAAGVVTVTARHKGALSADLDFYVPVEVSGNIFAGTNIVIASTEAGSGDPTTASALAALGDDNADMVISPWGDVANLNRYETTMSDVSGRGSYLRQVYGHVHTVTTGNTAARHTLGAGRNDRHCSIVERVASSGDYNSAWAWATASVAAVMHKLFDGVLGGASVNHTGVRLQGIRAPRTKSVLPDYAARNASLKTGLSTWMVRDDGSVVIDKLITTYQQNPLAQPDTTFRDIQWVGQMTFSLRQFRADLSYEHGQKAIADSNPGNLGAISTTKDIKATMISSAERLARGGVLENVSKFVLDLVVERNAGNPNRVDVMAPLDRVNPLDIIAANARLYAQYRDS